MTWAGAYVEVCLNSGLKAYRSLQLSPDLLGWDGKRLGLTRTIHYRYIRCTYGVFSREITIHTVIYGAYTRFWPTLHTVFGKTIVCHIAVACVRMCFVFGVELRKWGGPKSLVRSTPKTSHSFPTSLLLKCQLLRHSSTSSHSFPTSLLFIRSRVSGGGSLASVFKAAFNYKRKTLTQRRNQQWPERLNLWLRNLASHNLFGSECACLLF
jgi:hypothetical protein